MASYEHPTHATFTNFSELTMQNLTLNDYIETASGRIMNYHPIVMEGELYDETREMRQREADVRILKFEKLDENIGNMRSASTTPSCGNQRNEVRIEPIISTFSSTLNVPSSSSSTSVIQPGLVPELPPGKMYHVFFSHSREDREWVLQVVLRLESPQYGFKCCFADRDFDLGVPVFQNITKCIHASRRTVIVMSPEFVESPWCSYETRIIVELDLDARQRLLIPVMLRQCRVPDFIGRLSYMEVDNQHFWSKFVDALKDPGQT